MPNIAAELAQLRRLSRPQLLEKWRELYGRPAPHLRRELLIPFLAYKIQENAFGGLRPSVRTELRRVARALETTPNIRNRNVTPRAKAGTRLVRHWRGQEHEVLVTESAFEYGGISYTSLSPIARQITGTSWSGPAFFGLRKPTSEQGHAGE